MFNAFGFVAIYTAGPTAPVPMKAEGKLFYSEMAVERKSHIFMA